MIETYSNPHINWTWYVRLERSIPGGTTCRILEVGRRHYARDVALATQGDYAFIEDNARVVRIIRLKDEDLQVTNPQHVFSYPDLGEVV
jgi:hypothetical protein